MPEAIPLEEGRSAFGADSETYNDGRVDYPARIYEILRNSDAVTPEAQTFEIGPGTGQATVPLLTMGCRIIAIEPDKRLASFLQKKLRKYGSALTVAQSSFEDIDLPPASFDLGIAATSLHWLYPEAALAKVFRLLRPGGWWGMWWTVFGDPGDRDEFQRRSHPLFQRLSQSPSYGDDSGRPFALDRNRRFSELRKAGFPDVAYEEIRWQPILITRQVQRLTATFSPVARLSERERMQFLKDIGLLVDQEFGGHVRRHFVTALYLARKPCRTG